MKLLLCAILFASAARAADAPPKAGEKAPDFTLTSQDGSRVSLHDFKGQWVVLYFYPKDGSPGCTIEAHTFQRDLPRYQQKHAVILAVSMDSANSHQQFCAKEGLRFRMLADTEKQVSAEYGSVTNLLVYKMSARNTFLIDPAGKIALVWTGVSPGRHSTEVLAALGQLSHF